MVWNLFSLWPRWRPPVSLRCAARPRPAAAAAEAWRRDPLAHPALQAMSQRELADLPFDPRDVDED